MPVRSGSPRFKAHGLQGAAQIIVVDPIRYRREAALALGATVALDPNVEGDNLVRKIQELCTGKTGRHLAGGGNVGPDFVIEAVGGDLFPPKTEVGPDPTGIRSLQQAWDLCSPVGHVVTLEWGPSAGKRRVDSRKPVGEWREESSAGQPRRRESDARHPAIRATDRGGLFNAKALATATFPLERSREAFQAAADRTTVAAVVVFN